MSETERVLLIHPGIYDDRDNPQLFAPWGSINVGSALLAAGHTVEVVDLNGRDIEVSLRGHIQKSAPTVIGVTCKLGLAASRFRRIVDVIRSDAPYIKVVAGGPLVSSFPNFDHPIWRGVDALFWGDGEIALPHWLSLEERPRGLFESHDAVDLDDIGVPSWWPELKFYVQPPEQWPNMNVPGLHVASARGCTRRCTFCYLNSHYPTSRFRYVSAPRLYNDLRVLHGKLGASGFYFVDDCFVDRPGRRVADFSALNIADGSPFRYGCDVQLPDLEDREMLLLMHKAGFRSLYVGVESASARIRKSLGKGTVRTELASLLDRTLDMGFVIRASIGIGWPGETEEDVRATLRLVDRVPRLSFDAFKYLPLPNTPLGESSYWSARRSGGEPDDEQIAAAYEDYSVYNRNYSEMSDEVYGVLWRELTVRESERLASYFTRGA